MPSRLATISKPISKTNVTYFTVVKTIIKMINTIFYNRVAIL